MFSSEVTWPVCTEKDKRIGKSDIVSSQPPVSVAEHAEHEERQNILILPRTCSGPCVKQALRFVNGLR